ncbi:MAG: phosphate ABC transporter substrate-binding protein [Acetobacteraceae bacterium]|nr:phosphate ABC transporter substrate-binding protein [Acetobacteraceae bacterium]
MRLSPARLWAAALALALAGQAGCSGHSGGARLVVVGSTSVQPFIELLAEEYSATASLTIDVQGGGSSAGIQAVRAGAADLGMSSRPLAPGEAGLVAVPIARDALALVVHPSNPVRDLDREQIRALFSGAVPDWSKVGGTDRRVTLIIREEGSGTRSAFEDLIMQGVRNSPRALVQDSNGSVRETVAQDPAAIGYISLGLVNQRVRPLRVDGVEPRPETVRDGTYPLSRAFLLVYRPPLSPPAQAFLDFVLSPEGQALLASEGLLPVAPAREVGRR